MWVPAEAQDSVYLFIYFFRIQFKTAYSFGVSLSMQVILVQAEVTILSCFLGRRALLPFFHPTDNL